METHLREVKPEFVGLLVEAVKFLSSHSAEFAFQVGGARNFGAGDADVWVINPLYSEREVRPAFVDAFHARVAARDPECDAGIPEADTIDGTGGDDP